MKLSNLLSQFKRYAMIEKGMTHGVTNEILSITQKLIDSGYCTSIENSKTASIRAFLYERKELRNWTNRTFRNKRQYLKSFYDFCIQYEFLHQNPIDKIVKPKVTKSLPRCLSRKDTNRILATLENTVWHSKLQTLRNKALIKTFLFSGMRLMELQNLKSHEVLIDEGIIKIVKGKGKKDRMIPIHCDLLRDLRNYKLSKTNPTIYFFSSIKSDARLTRKNIYSVFYLIRTRSRVKFTPHMLRHTFAKMSIEANLNPFILKEILGHSDISTTQIYVAVSDRRTIESFQNLHLI